MACHTILSRCIWRRTQTILQTSQHANRYYYARSEEHWKRETQPGGKNMDFLNDLLGFVEAAFEGVFRFVRMLLFWSFDQVAAIPWGALSYLPVWKVMLLSAIMALFLLFLYRMGLAFLEAGEKALTALILLMTVFIRGMPIIVLAGIAAAAGAWVINNVNF